MNNNKTKRWNWRVWLCALLIAALTMMGVTAEETPEVEVHFDETSVGLTEGESVDAISGEDESEASIEMDDGAIDGEAPVDIDLALDGLDVPELLVDELEWRNDAINEVASATRTNASNPKDFEIENGVLEWYKGPGGDVVIPDGVTRIGQDVFSECRSLKSVVIPDSVTSIGERAFSDTGLISVNIPDSVISIEGGAFSYCKDLVSVNIPVNATTISDACFAGCVSLQNITIPFGITKIEQLAFEDCTRLISITIPDGVTEIGAWAFARCTSLKQINIPDTVSIIGRWAFSECTKLESILIPIEITNIEENTFDSCANLVKVVIPQNVKEIGKRAFVACSKLNEVRIAEGVSKIGDLSFQGCSSLRKVYLPKSVVSISNNAFEGDDEHTICSEKMTIYGYRDSFAEKYAAKNKISFVVLDAPTETPVEPVKITLNKKKVTLVAGAKLALKASLTPAGAESALTWTSSNKKVATVTQKGVVKALRKGTATITVRTANGKKAACKITVPIAPTKIAFVKKNYSVKVGKKIALKTSLTPAKAKTRLTWTSSNKKIATVSSKGVVKGIRKGKVVITVKTANGKKAKVKVTVN